MASALGHIFVGFLAVFGRHNIRPPHFASKVSYSASPQTFADVRATPLAAATAILFCQKSRRDFPNFERPTLQGHCAPLTFLLCKTPSKYLERDGRTSLCICQSMMVVCQVISTTGGNDVESMAASWPNLT